MNSLMGKKNESELKFYNLYECLDIPFSIIWVYVIPFHSLVSQMLVEVSFLIHQ